MTYRRYRDLPTAERRYRDLPAAERIAPQHLHSSALVRETTRALLEQSRRRAAGGQLRGRCERMGAC